MSKQTVEVCDFDLGSASTDGGPVGIIRCRKLADSQCTLCSRDGCDEHLPHELFTGMRTESRKDSDSLTGFVEAMRRIEEQKYVEEVGGLPGPAAAPDGDMPDRTVGNTRPIGYHVLLCTECWQFVNMHHGELEPYLKLIVDQFHNSTLEALRAFWSQKALTK